MTKKSERIKCISVCCAPTLFVLGVCGLLLAAQDWNVPKDDNTIALLTNGSIQTPYASIIELVAGLLLTFATIPVLQMAQKTPNGENELLITHKYRKMNNFIEEGRRQSNSF
jgi:hypothetical protein